MAEFSWAYIDGTQGAAAAGPTGSVQYRIADSDGNTAMSGTQNFVYHTASTLLSITGSVEISGTLTANQYNINVVDKTVTNLSASGDTIFGDTSDDTHQFTGSLLVNGNSTFAGNIAANGNTTLGNAASDVVTVTGQLTASQGITANGNANLNGNTTLGNAAADVVTVTGQLTASQGALFNEQIVIVDDKNLVFGSGGESLIKYDEASSDNLVVSGSALGLMLMGAKINVNSPSMVASNTDIIVTGSITVTGSALNTTTVVNGTHISSSLNISGSSFYGDGSKLSGIAATPAGLTNQIQFNNAGSFGSTSRATIAAGASAAALVITGSVTVTGSALNTTTVINGTHLSSSLNISGSSIYAEDGFFGNISVPRFVIHEGDADTYLDFTDDNLMIKVGNKEFVTIDEGASSTFVINRLAGAIETTINSDNGDALNVKVGGVVINDAGMPGHDFRVESNQKQNAIYLDADLQYVHLLADNATPAGGLGADMALFVSGTVGSKNTSVRGTAVFGGDMVVSGNLYGAYGNSGEIQFNNGGAFGASPSATVVTTPDGSSMLTLTGSLQVVSGSTKVLQVDSSALGLGEVRGRMVQHIRTGFDLSDADDALAGRYVSIGGNAVAVSATPNQVNCMITPFSGRLISIMYHMPSPASKQDPSKGQPQWQLRVGDVNTLKGQTFANAFSTVGQITASSWPGSKVVGGVDIQTKIGSLHGNNITGSFSFGTGSVVALFFKSADTGLSANNFPGAASFTTVWEFDQLDPYNSGSGN